MSDRTRAWTTGRLLNFMTLERLFVSQKKLAEFDQMGPLAYNPGTPPGKGERAWSNSRPISSFQYLVPEPKRCQSRQFFHLILADSWSKEWGQPQGATGYRYTPVGEQDLSPRILVPVQIEEIETEAVVDTGGIYLICTPEIAKELQLDPGAALGRSELNIRGHSINGALYRVALTLIAEEGKGCVLEATAFVPDDDPLRIWDLPVFLGMQGCLERMRFAVDPKDERFFFGPIEWEA